MNKTYRCAAALIRQAIAEAGSDGALVVMTRAGVAIPLTHTCGAVLDHSYVRMIQPVFDGCMLTGTAVSEDAADMNITFGRSDIVWVYPEVVEV
ncbi:hypothetical protein [Desulfobacter vibrioformis]|uniref:hypothetical protein n=1 Tax=Desulfobacter vibrioformis TaxID=34031 RepID=UPI000552B20B|nr:hypothetical protein [Desulfobacter vibrioformis]